MKTSIILDEIDRDAVRPAKEFSRYAEYLRFDLARLLIEDEVRWIERDCPGCCYQGAPVLFHKDGVTYHDCPRCFTRFVSPVPEQAALDVLGVRGRAAQFRRHLFEQRLKERFQASLRTNVLDWLLQRCDENSVGGRSYCEIGGENLGWFADVAENRLFEQVTLVSPIPTVLETPGVRQVGSLEQAGQGFDVLVTHTALDRHSDPDGLLGQMADHLAPGGLLAITAACASGLEHRLLGRDAPSLLPLDRLTVFSVEGIQTALERHGLRVIELSTPGRMDVETVASYLAERVPQETGGGDFWRYLMGRSDPMLRRNLQIFLQENLLSSYLRVAAIKV